ncbi:PREDICTED: hepcidin-like [Poecilia mexicana]|uniref:hepcidin-like n=1 Tax=Poecilia mexicana TaxID=48701 RepID=UPI00072E3A06|nr:PREDICTED: hepcidin-like [Poecilia mexicana]
MKTFAVAVTVSLLLTFLCVQENSAVPVDEGLEVPTDDGSLAADQDTPEESWNMPYDSVHMRRRRRRRRCRFCCDCCPNESGCGTCCKF